jgi:outer membrane lipoprotein SlyB
LAFETITAGGKTYPMTADLKEIVANSKGVKQVDEEGQVIGVKSNKKKIAGTLAGEGIGAVVGGLAGGGKGAAAGGAAGAVTGYLLSVTFSANGSNIEFAPGSEFLLVTSDRNKAG